MNVYLLKTMSIGHLLSGVFLIPYLIFLFSAGIPLVLVDLAIGQISRKGNTSGWGFSRIFHYIGVAKFFLSLVSSVFRNLVMSWAVFYLCATIISHEIPWKSCDPSWASPCK